MYAGTGSHRRWAVSEDGELLAVCCYRKGAFTIKGRLDALQAQVEQLRGSQAERYAKDESCVSP